MTAFRRTIRRLGLLAAAAAVAAGVCVSTGSAAVFSDDCLPPPQSAYRANAPLVFNTSAGTVELSDVLLTAFNTTCDRLPKSGSSTASYDALLLGTFSLNGGPDLDLTTTARLGQITTAPTSKGGKSKTYGLELTQFDPLELPLLGYKLRESPSLGSLGSAVVTGAPKGAASVDGFFDVSTELSVDNGLTWSGAGAPTRFDVVPRP